MKTFTREECEANAAELQRLAQGCVLDALNKLASASGQRTFFEALAILVADAATRAKPAGG